ncbi:hypothetical protein [Alteromonas sp. ASW11-130]|uniref:hypothetical protein n=1 Tax=Alteromonas sp. ASW11-130 TaxID=3015775 RepID=UPI002241C064|nr:hypothetical protein [Alteromonas sp. ASW11-130]MCW8091858.1 hypothetical protein [Alteromonas sp. ASW11-130]
MTINATLLGLIIVVLACVMAGLGYYLGKRKTQTPGITAVIAFVTAFIPPVALIFLIVLVFKSDIPKASSHPT